MAGGLILASLNDLAHTEGLTADLDYEPRLVSWVISLDADGHCVGLIPTAVPQEPKEKLLAKTMHIPRRSGRTSSDSADFLVDKPEYVLGVVPETNLPEKRLKRLEPRRLLFGIEKAAAATSHAGLKFKFAEGLPWVSRGSAKALLW